MSLLRAPSYRNLSLTEAINRYAPPSENHTAHYVDFVAKRTGIDTKTVLSSLTDADLSNVAKSIQKIEGWTPGKQYSADKPRASISARAAGPASSAAPAATDWMRVALREESLPPIERSEWADPGENPRILNYIRVAAPWFDPMKDGGDEVHWCASFVNYCLERAGYRGTGHPGARSFFWNKDRHFIELEKPQYGCIGVFRDAPFADAAWKNGNGHVGFITRWTDTEVELLGGNQSNTVKREWYAKTSAKSTTVKRKLVAYLMPAMN
ncbi:conjugal transfer protein [Methylobacterium sp. 17Sr1-1]|nr:conjugal transfer protein [Methylobacterium sp. 17Sr1-1]